jgi:hypothetical protein
MSSRPKLVAVNDEKIFLLHHARPEAFGGQGLKVQEAAAAVNVFRAPKLRLEK